jgi:hypothetical protein
VRGEEKQPYVARISMPSERSPVVPEQRRVSDAVGGVGGKRTWVERCRSRNCSLTSDASVRRGSVRVQSADAHSLTIDRI